MLIRKERLNLKNSFEFELIAPKERLIFFDIETTGLTARNSQIYMIGAAAYDDEGWVLTQFFSEDLFDEAEVIEAFLEFLNDKKRLGRIFLISYNGDGFDIPFIKNCLRHYGMSFDFRDFISYDVIKLVRPYKNVIGLEKCRLKEVEAFLGLNREDIYSGGELIHVYEEYLSLKQTESGQKLLNMLLLHNAEDIAGMIDIMPVVSYHLLFEGAYEVEKSGIDARCWEISIRLDARLPKPISWENKDIILETDNAGKFIFINVKLYNGSLKYFFPDSRDYYYLPKEDMAIHKSVGGYLDKKSRKQATNKTCYQWYEGTFVQQYEPIFEPVFYKEYKEKPYYGDIGKFLKVNDGKINIDITKRYIMSVLRKLREY